MHLVHPFATPDNDSESVRKTGGDFHRRDTGRCHHHFAGKLPGVVECGVVETPDGQGVESLAAGGPRRPDNAWRHHGFIGSELDVGEMPAGR